MSVDLSNNGLTFRANGSKVKFAGFMKVYVEGKDDQLEEKDRMLPDLKEGDTVLSKDIEPEQHFTQPPPRYTEARLVKTLEELGSTVLRHMRRLLTPSSAAVTWD